jgi:hypothetical protein
MRMNSFHGTQKKKISATFPDATTIEDNLRFLAGRFSWLAIFISIVFVTPCNPAYAEEYQGIQSYLSVGVGWEQLSYTEKVPELSVDTSDTEINNTVLYFDGAKRLHHYFAGIKGILPIIYDDTQEYWRRAGQYEQSNTLSYRRTKVDVYFGYMLNQLVNPYIGTSWSYSSQERYNFQNADTPGVVKNSTTEELNALFLLLGVRGRMPMSLTWSFEYFIEYLRPYYSKVENSLLDEWHASDIDGYAFSLTGQLQYLITDKTALIVQAIGGKQYWDGSDWERVDDSQVKWPENKTVFIGCSVIFKKYF